MPGQVYKRGKVWWVKFYHNGKPYRTSSYSTVKRDAEQLLRMYLGEIAQGIFRGIKTQRKDLTVNEVIDDYLRDCEQRGLRKVHKIMLHAKPVRKVLGDRDASTLDERDIDQFIKYRLGQGVTRTTVNRGTQLLGQALRLAQRKKLITNIPYIQRFKENNARQEYFEQEEFEEIVSYLPEDLKNFVRFALVD